MYKKYSKGETVKTKATTNLESTFPAVEDIELWKQNELKRYDVLERPIRNLYENDIEHDKFVKDLMNAIKISKSVDGNNNEDSILYGCELEVSDIDSDEYITLTPGLFTVDGEVYQIYPTCYTASRQLEEKANLYTENGLEYINITYEDNKFNAYIKINGKEKEEIIGENRGIELLKEIVEYLNNKNSYYNITEVINIDIPLEDFQLEPTFKYNGGALFVEFKDGEIEANDTGAGFDFGNYNGSAITGTLNIWDGFPTVSIKDQAITNEKLANMEHLTIKGRVFGTNGEPEDIGKVDLIEYFQMVSTDDDQEISGIKTFTTRQKFENDIPLTFDGNEGEKYWTIKGNTSNKIEIVYSGPSSKSLTLDSSGLLKSEKFETNETYTLNNLNVEKFNGHTITNEETPSAASSITSMILWKPSDSSEIQKTTFADLPKAVYDTVEKKGTDGLMTWENLERIRTLEDMAGWVDGDQTINLIGEVNGITSETGGGAIDIYSGNIYINDDEEQTIEQRLELNKGDLERIATHLPEGNGTIDADKVIISMAEDNNPTWGKITDNQISSTITKVSPVTAPTNKEEYGIAFWNAGANRLHRDMDVSYDPGNDTLTATNVTSRSSRKLKKDIEVYTESAFNTLDKIEVVSFHFIDDETQADKVGFIAEDSPTLVAGLNHDKMDMNNCIGLLIKAVQELKEENEDLRDELRDIRNNRTN